VHLLRALLLKIKIGLMGKCSGVECGRGRGWNKKQNLLCHLWIQKSRIYWIKLEFTGKRYIAVGVEDPCQIHLKYTYCASNSP